MKSVPVSIVWAAILFGRTSSTGALNVGTRVICFCAPDFWVRAHTPKIPDWRRAIVPLATLAVCLCLSACGGSSGHAPGVRSYTISGSVAHLDAAGLTISDGFEAITVAQGATEFAFSRPIPTGDGYQVSVAGQPAGENCAVISAGNGIVSNTDVSNVSIACNTAVSSPLALNVLSSLTRIDLPVTMVGNNPVSINATVDTGSAGVTLNAFDIFPSSMVTTNGFAFPAGQNTLTYDGITVTNVRGSRSYGGQSASPTTRIGNLGFAQMTFDGPSGVTTAVIPILFVSSFR